MHVEFVIEEDGRVFRAKAVVVSGRDVPAIAACIEDMVTSFTFDPPSGGPVSVRYPFSF